MTLQIAQPARFKWPRLRPGMPAFIMAILLISLGVLVVLPVILILLTSFMVQPEVFVGERQWGLANWFTAFQGPQIFRALWHTFLVWGLTMAISMPVSVVIAWTLARTKVPFSNAIEFMFWVAYITPGGVIAWILLLDPQIGILNVLLRHVFSGLTEGPFNVFSLGGIVWVHLMSNGIALKVMLLTPAFRNMDVSLEEASRVGGASSIRTMLKVTLPLMAAPITLVFALQLVRIFQSFETELLLGTSWGFYVYSTLIYDLVRNLEPPHYGEASVLASLTLLIIAVVIPFQQWILSRKKYTTVTGNFKAGLIDLGAWKWIVFAAFVVLHLMLTVVQLASLVLGSFMTRSGYFQIKPAFTLSHWAFVFNDSLFITALKTTLTLSATTALVSPVLFAVIAYILVRTRWPGRKWLDTIIWCSAAMPGMLAGLGLLMLFLGTPGLSALYGTIWAMLIVVVLQGKVTGVNILKANLVQIGADMEEASRASGAGWIRTFFQIWIPLLMPTLVIIGTMHFVIAATTTASIILLAARGTITLSILVLQYASPIFAQREAASVVSILIAAGTIGLSLMARRLASKLSVMPRD